jgi:hypothetical protein
MAPQARESLPQCRTGREIAADKFEPEMFDDHPPRVEVPSALLQEADGALGEPHLRGELTLGDLARLAVLPELATEAEIGRKFAQIGVQIAAAQKTTLSRPVYWTGTAASLSLT